MTGAYLRVKRGERYENIEVEHLTVAERQAALGTRSPEELLRWLDLVCEKLSALEPLLDSLQRDGLITQRCASCDPSFTCYDGSERCRKPLA